MNTIKVSFFVLVTATFYTLVACSAHVGFPSTPTNTMIASQLSLSATSTRQVAKTLASTNTPTVVPTATFTPLPTLSVEQGSKEINNLISNNGGCQIPCWWGIIPSKTTWSEAIHFLAPFSEIKQGESGSFNENGKKHYETNYSIYYRILGKKESQRMLFAIQDELVIGIRAYPPSTNHRFKLDQMLRLFGKPNQIYVSAQPDSQTDHLLPAIILLDYSNVGIWASYEYPLSKLGETLTICPQAVGARLELWDPEIKYSHAIPIEEYINMLTGFKPRKLNDVTKMSIESFFENYRNPNTTTCLDTPVNIWP